MCGGTHCERPPGSLGAVYPRVCGGTPHRPGPSLGASGLSPRVRGNLRRGCSDSRTDRSIPACAGEPGYRQGKPTRYPVYPRVCGGTAQDRINGHRQIGLSPRVRGNHDRREPHTANDRSIPACAGEPQQSAIRRSSPQVYPRVCGGTDIRVQLAGQLIGLSPRVRGNPDHRATWRCRLRSIPACAGEPNVGLRKLRGCRVYPRVCGGTRLSEPGLSVSRGLSPRVRGNPIYTNVNSLSKRSIPACAGEPHPPGGIGIAESVYPRVCGGTFPKTRGRPGRKGLSPRVRGNRRRRQEGRGSWRSIPACAGEPRRR